MRRRSGFSLVEVLVSTVLIIFILVLMAEVLRTVLGTFRQLKATGDMNERLRTVTNLLRRDFDADHFEGRRRLSDPTFWTEGTPREGFFRHWQGSTANAFVGTTIPYAIEGNDADALASQRANNHILHFTVKLRGNERQDFFSARVPAGSPLLTNGLPDSRYQDTANTFTSQWAEVVYFMRPNGGNAGSTPLFSLYRRQRVLVPEDNEVNWSQTAGRFVSVNSQAELDRLLKIDYAEVSVRKADPNPTTFPDRLYFNNPTSITIPQRRFGMDPVVPGGLPTVRNVPAQRIVPNDSRTWSYPTFEEDDPLRAGSDLLLTDVISFQVQRVITNGGDFTDIPSSSTTQFVFQPTPPPPRFVPRTVPLNSEFWDTPSSTSPPTAAVNRPRVFDTWTEVRDNWYDYSDSRATTANGTGRRLPNQNNVFAVRITLRIWDVKTQQTRQVSIIQDM